MKCPMFFFLLSCMFLTGCASQNLFRDKGKPAADTSVFKINPYYQYTIRKDDKINISVWNNDDLSVGSAYGIYNSNEVYGKWLLVDANGEISIPQIGNLKVEGLSVIEMKDTLTKQLAKYIVNPVVDIKVLNKEVTVMGELKMPGKILLEKDNNTLVDILGRAGDFDFYADKSKIKVIRVVNSQPKEITVDLTNMNDYYSKNIQIQPGDVVYVPSKKGKEWDRRAGSTVVPAAAVISSIVLLTQLLK